MLAYLGIAIVFRQGDGQPAHYLRRARPAGLPPLLMLGLGALLVAAGAYAAPLALLGIPALFVEDLAWVRAGQLPPNS
jgi:hypothetical protein